MEEVEAEVFLGFRSGLAHKVREGEREITTNGERECDTFVLVTFFNE